MRMYNDGEKQVITGDEEILSQIEGADLRAVVVPEVLSRADADNLAKAYSIAVSQPHVVTFFDETVVVEKNENIKIYAVLKQQFVKGFEKR